MFSITYTGVGTPTITINGDDTGNQIETFLYRANNGTVPTARVIVNNAFIYTFSNLSYLVVNGGSANDLIVFNTDTNYGPSANDLLGVTVSAGGGDDNVSIEPDVSSTIPFNLGGGAGNDTLLGGAGNDTLGGAGGNDSLSGGAGNDLLLATELGADTLVGGDGIDTADYSGKTTPLSLSQNNLADDGEAGEGDNLNQDVEVWLGGSANDTLAASTSWTLPMTLIGNGGDDYIYGSGGNDSLGGAGGNDTVIGNGGDDYISGGAGNDSVGGAGGNDTVLGLSGNDTVAGGAGNNLLYGDDPNNSSATGSDTFFAINSAVDTLDGGAGSGDVNTAHVDQSDVLYNIQSVLYT